MTATTNRPPGSGQKPLAERNRLSRLLVPTAPSSTGLFPRRRMIGIGIFSVVALAAGLLANIQWQTSITLALLTCMGAASLNLLMGTAGQVSLGNAAMLAVGAFSTVWFLGVGVPFPFDVAGAGLTAAIAGLIIGFPALRLRGLYLAIATLAAHFIIIFLAVQYQNAAAGPSGFVLDPVIPGKLAQSQAIWVVIVVVVLAFVSIIVGALSSGRSGRTWRLIRDHENVVSAFGINATRWKLGVFVISSAILGVQGSLFAHYSGALSTESFTLGVAILYVAMVIIGGLDSLAGSILGAILISLLPTVVPAIVKAFSDDSASPAFGANLSTIVYGALILVFVVFLPKGIVGSAAAALRRGRSR